MIILNQIVDGHIASCKSDDGLVTALICPITTLYGEFDLVDADGRKMWRGLYPDADGFYRDEKVPAHIWESAINLMHEWNSIASVREEAARRRSIERDARRHSVLSERLAADMDRADSDL